MLILSLMGKEIDSAFINHFLAVFRLD